MVDPAAALGNLKRLAKAGLRGSTATTNRSTTPDGGGGRTGKALSFAPLWCTIREWRFWRSTTVLHAGVMPSRFHADRRVQAAEPLLFERAPVAPLLVEATERAEPPARLQASGPAEPTTSFDAPAPATELLGNGDYTVMVTAAGGGFSRWRGLDITRWRADTTLDAHGTFYYIKDVESGVFWSAAYQPTRRPASRYMARFGSERVELERRDFGIGAITAVAVSPDDAAEIHYLTLANYSNRRRAWN